MKKAVFLDRDGVINKKREDYVKSIEEFILLKDSPSAIKLLNENGFLVIVITNQSAVSRGYLSREELENIHDFMKSELIKQDSHVDAIYYCPHKPEEDCSCRKPKTKLVTDAIHDFLINKDSSWFIGDNDTDVLCAKRMGMKSKKMKANSSLLYYVKEIISNQ